MPARPDLLFGILHLDPRRHATRDELRRIAADLDVPGADVEVDGSFGIGLQRHVVDPATQSNGLSRATDVCVAIAGEIANLSELAAATMRAGGPPLAHDADLLASSWRTGNLDAVTRAHGAFAALIWDRSRRELVLLADRCGTLRPLYLHRNAERIVFGSSVKAVLVHRDVPRVLDPTALEDLLVLGHPLRPCTMLAGVETLEAGTMLHVSETQGATVRRYWQRRPWDPSRAPSSGDAHADADLDRLEREYLDALERAVARLAGGDDAHVMLSGGVDSAAIVALLRRLGQRRIHTYFVHAGDGDHVEHAVSVAIARHFGTEHRSLDLDVRSLDVLPRILWDYEAPTINVHPTYALGGMVREACDVVLGGHGNDVLWGVARPGWAADTWLRRAFPSLGARHYLTARRSMDRRALRALLRGAESSDAGLRQRVARSRIATGDGTADAIALDEALFGDQIVCRELGKVLVDAHGLWPRLPYADASVLRVAESVPPALRLHRRDGVFERKAFFKRALESADLLPREWIYRRKEWMRSPVAAWLRGELRDVARAVLLGPGLRDRGLFDHERIATLLAEHASGTDHSDVLMMLVAIEIWHRLFIDRTSLAAPDVGLDGFALGDPS